MFGGLTPDSLMKRAFGAAGKSVRLEGVARVVFVMKDGTERTVIPFDTDKTNIQEQTAPNFRAFNIPVKEWYENGEYNPDTGQASV